MSAAGTAPVRIRSCGVQQAGVLAELHSHMFDAPWDAETFRELLAIPGTLALIAGPGAAVGVPDAARQVPWGLIVGRVVVDEAEVLTLGVARERRRLGVAARLLQKLCRIVGRRGAQRLFLEVAEGNAAARALYSRLGFQELGRRRGYYERCGAPPEDAVNLCLTLAHYTVHGVAAHGAPVDGAQGVTYNGAANHVLSEDMQASPQPASRIEKLCADKRLRMTGQRRVIARVLSEAKDHPDVEEVHRRAHAADPRISLSTVYRTLRLFETNGILERHDFGAGRGRYEEAARNHHDHLIDIETGRVIEFSNAQIERLQQRVAEELGFQLVGHTLELYGVPTKRPRR